MKDTKIKQKQEGFSLIELLVVIAIIGILAGIIMISLNNSRASGRDGKRVSDLKGIQTALAIYYEDCTGFPTATDLNVAGLGLDNTCAGWVANPTGTTVYLFAAPSAPTPADGTCTDSTPPDTNTYLYTGDAQTYSIAFCLGRQVADLPPGAHTLTPDGIQ